MPSQTILNLTLRLRIQIRDNGATPDTQAFPDVIDNTLATPAIVPGNSPELQQFLQSAIMIFSRYRSRLRPTTLVLQPGVLQYNLPTDWMSVDDDSWERAIHPSPIPDLNHFLLPWIETEIPLGVQFERYGYTFYDDDQLLVLNTAIMETTNVTLNFNYNAYHTADVNGTTIPLWQQDYVILKGAELALRALATDKGVALQKYRIGSRLGMEVDDSKVAENLLKQADDYNLQFRKEIILRPFGTSGGHDGHGEGIGPIWP